MNRKLITLMIVALSMAFFQNANAVEMSESGLVEIHGFITQGYIYTDENNFFADTEGDGTTQFNEVGINFSSDVSERLRLGIQFFARDFGKMGDGDITIDWATADYSFFDWLNLRAGKIKVPYGLYNTERDVDVLRTFVFLPQSLYYEGWRDSANAMNGAGFYGYIPAGVVGNFEYQLYGGNTKVPADGGVARLLRDEAPTLMDMDITYVDVDYMYTGQVIWDTVFGLDGLRLVASNWEIEFGAQCNYDTLDYAGGTTFLPDGGHESSVFRTINNTYNASVEYSYGNFVFAVEYMKNQYELSLKTGDTTGNDGVDLLDGNSDGALISNFDAEGYYGSMTYRFTDWFEAGVYYSEYFSDTSDKDGTKKVDSGGLQPGMEHNQWSKDLCISTRFDISSNWLFKLEGHKMNGSALMYSDDGNTKEVFVPALGRNIDFLDYAEDWYIMAAKLSFNF